MLVFPDGVKLARANELPNSSDKSESLEKTRNAKIEQGYVVQTADETLFTCYAEANIDAPQIWQVFRSLCEELLPEESFAIIGEIDEEPLHGGSYAQTQELLALFERFSYYLANDCYIQFGLAAQSETELAEVFVTPTKHFQIWTNKASIFADVMAKFGIAETDELQFIDEFPRTTTALDYTGDFQSHDELINYLVQETEEQENAV